MARGPDTVFFLSDYGQRDEFAGVVRAVLRRLVPRVAVIDLTHEIPPFDVRAGAAALGRALPHLGDGVVLAVVDPGVGSPRRAVALRAGGEDGRCFVGPDNGLLLPAADLAGGVSAAVELSGSADPDGPTTFDGRDLFAPAVARLCGGAALRQLGAPLDPTSLVRLESAEPRRGELDHGRAVLWCEVTWVDRFGNAQLNAGPGAAAGAAVLVLGRGAGPPSEGPPVRRVRAFGELGPGEVGLLTDASGRLALVLREGSAAEALGLAVGDTVGLAERPPTG